MDNSFAFSTVQPTLRGNFEAPPLRQPMENDLLPTLFPAPLPRLGKGTFKEERHGWNSARWPEDGVPECYQEALEVLCTQLTLAAAIPESVPSREGVPLPKSGRIRMTCGCERPRRTYVSRGVAQDGGIPYKECDELFTVSTEMSETD